MPRSSDTFKGEAGKSAVASFWLLQVLDIPERRNPSNIHSLYLTDRRESVTYAGQLYTACALTVERVEVSKDNTIDQCRISIDNVDSSFTSLAHQAELTGVRVALLRALDTTVGSPDGAQVIFVGHILSVAIEEPGFVAVITPDFSLKTRIPRELYWGRDFPYLPSAKDPTQVFTG